MSSSSPRHYDAGATTVLRVAFMLPLVLPLVMTALVVNDRMAARLRSHGNDRGASTVEWIVLVGVVVALAIAVGKTITDKVNDKAKALNLDAPAGEN